MKLKILVAIVLLAFVALGVSSIVSRDNKIQLKDIELQSKQSEIKQLQIDYELLDQRQDELIQSHSKDKKELEKVRKEKEELLERQKQLEKEVSAKREAKRLAEEKSRSVASVGLVATASASSGSCDSWLDQAGITHALARELIQRESGCNPCAYNPRMSDCNYTGESACGIPQALPCSKLRDTAGCGMTNAVCQLVWMQNYVYDRYGSWEAAIVHHDLNNWY